MFPAYAGVIPDENMEPVVRGSVPRVCGGDPRDGLKVMIGVFPAYAGVIPGYTII